MLEIKENNRLILSLDVTNQEKAFKILREVYDYIDAIKIGYPLILSCGIGINKMIKNDFALPLIADFKLSDVPITNRKIIDIAINNGIDFITINGFIGLNNLLDAKNYADKRVGFFMITELTTDIGFTLYPFDYFAMLALQLNFYGVQAPATKPDVIKRIKKIIGDSLKIISCGIGVQGGKIKNAINAGTNFVIVGRTIYEAQEPRKVVKKYIKEIHEVTK